MDDAKTLNLQKNCYLLLTFVMGLKMFDCALLTPAITSATVGTFGSEDIVLISLEIYLCFIFGNTDIFLLIYLKIYLCWSKS